MNQIINMIVRMVVRRAVTMGIDKGVDVMAKRKGYAEASNEQKAQAAETKKRTKQSLRMMRRFGRF